MKKKRELIFNISHIFEKEKISWALGASSALYFRGLISSINDVDIFVDRKDSKRAEELLLFMGEKALEEDHNEMYASHTFSEFTIDGISIDVGSHFTVLGKDKLSLPLVKEFVEELSFPEGKVYLMSLEEWSLAYMAMGDPKKRLPLLIEHFCKEGIRTDVLYKYRQSYWTKTLLDELLDIKEIVFGSQEYKKELDLRNRLMRLPHGVSIYDENLEAEAYTSHYGVFLGDDLLATGQAFFIGDNRIQIRSFCVEKQWQKLSIGKRLLEYMEEKEMEKGAEVSFLNARSTAVDFYQAHGYKVMTEEYLLESIQVLHKDMEKKLKG